MGNHKSKIKILVACHKSDPNIRQDNIYIPIQVGKALHPEVNLGFQCDNTGDNISIKNDSYCELTAIYWAWKNLRKDVEYVGLAHYRRYLDIKESVIPNILGKKDIILLKGGRTPFSNLFHLTEGTTREDVYILLKYIEKYQPQYLQATIDYLYNSNKWIGCNMFITTREIFNSYCNWLFPLLQELEKYVPIPAHARLKRIYGYFGEVLLPIYCIANKLSIDYKPSYKSQIKLIDIIKILRNNLLFKLSNIRKKKSINIPESTVTSFAIDKIII